MSPRELEVLRLVATGLANNRSAAGSGSASAPVGSLIDRMMPATRGRSPVGDATPGGKHRRTV